MKFANTIISAAAGLAGMACADAASAGTGHPDPWQLGLQDAVTPSAHGIHSLHTFVLWMIIIITLFVLGLLIYVMVKFNAKAHPVPSRTTHNSLIEVLWTVIPILVLVAMAIPSFRLLYLQRDIPTNADMTLKVTGNPSWNWTYDYPDLGKNPDGSAKVSFSAYRLEKPDAEAAGEPYLLATDVPVVVPVNKIVKLLVTSDPEGIIHAWTIPSFGMKIDAIPGRLNEDWFNVEKEGIYYGQCSELCGKDHAFMPIEVWAVAEDKYKAWGELMLKSPDDKTLKAFLATIKPAAQVAQN